MKIFNLTDVLPRLPALIFKGQFGFDFEKLPYCAQGIGLPKAFNFFRAGLNQYLLPARPLGAPVIAQVEPSNYCNLACPLCLTASITQSRPRTLLAWETFKCFIDECGDSLLLLIFWNWGEPFLNPDFIKMIAYAKAKGIVVHSSTNGNVPLGESAVEALVDSGLDSLVVAVDGGTQETYAKYRQGGRLERVVANIKNIIRVRTAKRSTTPRINMRFVVMRHNESELPLVRALAAELGVDYFTLKTVDMHPEMGSNLDQTYAPEQTEYRRYDYDQETFTRKERSFACMRPWKRITLDASGEIIPCEYDFRNRYSFGNIRDRGALGAWKSQTAMEFRRAFQLGRNDFEMCRQCTYKNRVADDCTVERQVIGQTAK
jgi:radical SAM protein with 4Fe4S-binding SPASM domain